MSTLATGRKIQPTTKETLQAIVFGTIMFLSLFTYGYQALQTIGEFAKVAVWARVITMMAISAVTIWVGVNLTRRDNILALYCFFPLFPLSAILGTIYRTNGETTALIAVIFCVLTAFVSFIVNFAKNGYI